LTINEAIKFLHNLLGELDTVDNLLSSILTGGSDFDHWRDRIDESEEAPQQLEALRQAIVQDHWQAAIEKGFPDPMDRFQFMEEGEFQYKNPLSEVRAGRARA
jgi:hypothetical protein